MIDDLMRRNALPRVGTSLLAVLAACLLSACSVNTRHPPSEAYKDYFADLHVYDAETGLPLTEGHINAEFLVWPRRLGVHHAAGGLGRRGGRLGVPLGPGPAGNTVTVELTRKHDPLQVVTHRFSFEGPTRLQDNPDERTWVEPLPGSTWPIPIEYRVVVRPGPEFRGGR